MSFFKRLVWDLTGKERYRLADQMALLGAPAELIAAVRRTKDVDQESLFLEFVRGAHACVLDWRATREDVYEEIEPLLRAEERALLPKLNELPDDAAEAVAAIDRALVSSGRRLVHTESLGDFSIVILVPEAVHAGFLERVGPWRIAAG